jgi:hypothetical protein
MSFFSSMYFACSLFIIDSLSLRLEPVPYLKKKSEIVSLTSDHERLKLIECCQLS